MSNISANNINRKLIIVSMSLLSESMNSNIAIILCQLLFFQYGCHMLCTFITYFFDSAVLFDEFIVK